MYVPTMFTGKLSVIEYLRILEYQGETKLDENHFFEFVFKYLFGFSNVWALYNCIHVIVEHKRDFRSVK